MKPSSIWYSNPMWTHSGYGVACANILPRLKKAGYEVAMAPNVGFGGGIIHIEDIPIFPTGTGFSEVETVLHTVKHGYDFLITLYDIWPLRNLPNLVKRHRVLWVPYVPIDHDYLYPVISRILTAAFHIVPMSDYGKKLIEDAGFRNVTRIHLGVDTDAFRILDEKPKEVHRHNLGFEEDAFVIGLVQMNKDMRKLIPDQIDAIKMFIEENPDIKTRIYLHTEITRHGGYQLGEILQYPFVQLQRATKFPDQYEHFLGWTDQMMCKAYNGMDVLCAATSSEGFGMPIVEAMACGVPAVATNCTSMTELLEPTPELLVKPSTKFWALNNFRYYMPDKHDLVDKLEKVANSDPDYYARRCREHSKKFDWERVIVPQWMELLDYLYQQITVKCKRIPEPSEWLKERWKPCGEY